MVGISCLPYAKILFFRCKMRSKDYFAFESVSPYSKINLERYNNPKENFKAATKFISSKLSSSELFDETFSLLDVGCANAEFIYHANKVFPSATFTGLDMTKKFIDTAEQLSIPNTSFVVDDLFEYKKLNQDKFDIVTCFGTLPIFKDPSNIIDSLFSVLKPGGLLICDGYFNEFNIGINLYYRDDSVDDTKGVWRCDFNQHTIADVEAICSSNSNNTAIEKINFNIDIPRVPGAPNINVWTEMRADGSRFITCGANIILVPHMLYSFKSD